MSIHTDFKFHPRMTQLGCYWGDGGHTELYLLEGDGLVLVDTGVSTTPAAEVATALATIGRSLADISLVINTHGHHDHAGGNAAVVAAAGCPVWIHAADAQIAADPGYAFDLFFAPGQRLLGQHAALAAARARAAAEPPSPVDRQLTDGEVLDLGRGLRLRVVHTPGHTLGCITLLLEEEGLAISGDSVLGSGSRQTGLPLIFYPEEYRRTLDRLRALPLRTLCLGHHYRSLTMTRESVKLSAEVCRQFIDEAATVANLIEAAMTEALTALPGAPFAAVAGRALSQLRQHWPAGEVQGDSWPAGARETLAAAYLRQRGE